MLLVPSATSHGVYPTYPPPSLLAFSPANNPPTLSPPVHDRSVAYPFTIGPSTYHVLLHVAWPCTFAAVYLAAVAQLNAYNRRNNGRAWAFSRTLAFHWLVILHNALLAVYSIWTFRGMLRAIRTSWPDAQSTSVTAGGNGWAAAAADALCRMHGPRGLGSAATYNAGSWSIGDASMRLFGGLPDTTDVGRIWNEGLAYYGWIFYLSKYYEVVDSFVVLAKGRQSSRLQSYHHAGAMFAMWAGIKYMSPPIWMFTFINSGLHSLMYTYYAITAARIPVPRALKQTLTFLQIAQILFGSTYAALHLFVSYDVPAYYFARRGSPTVASLAHGASAAVPSASWLKRLALRAAGQAGLADNIPLGDSPMAVSQQQLIYTATTNRVHCLDTSGEVFAIVLNLVYLGPLAALFIKFFVTSYITKVGASKKEDKVGLTVVNEAVGGRRKGKSNANGSTKS